MRPAALLLATALIARLVEPAAAQPPGLVQWIETRPHAPRDTLADVSADAARIEAFERAVDAVARGARPSDGGAVIALGASVTAVVAGDDIGPTVVIDGAASRDLVIGVPHPVFEAGTAALGALLMERVGARALIVAGAHRCAARTESPCDGRTRACSGPAPAPYRLSDGAHNPATRYHAAHAALARAWPGAVFVSLHGMSAGLGIAAILSDGSTDRRATAALPEIVRDRLRAVPGLADRRVVSCNALADTGFTRLCGTTNAQGRLLNGSPDACGTGAPVAGGRFLHAELSMDDLRLFRRHPERWRDIPLIARLVAALDALPSVPR